MSTLTIHPIEYAKLHFQMDFGTILKRWFPLLLAFALIFICLMQLRESALMEASFNNAITEVVVPPFQSLPMEM